jgi:hypothetical protein
VFLVDVSGQVQIQRGEETYMIRREFDQSSKKWGYRLTDKDGHPAASRAKTLLKNAEVRDAILKGMQKYLNEAAFNFTRLFRW